MKVFCFIAAACALLLSTATAGAPQQYTEEDLDRILVDRRDKTKFYLFKGFSEDDRLKCEPLFDSRTTRIADIPEMQKTPFFSDVSEIDLAIARLQPFAKRGKRDEAAVNLMQALNCGNVDRAIKEQKKLLSALVDACNHYQKTVGNRTKASQSNSVGHFDQELLDLERDKLSDVFDQFDDAYEGFIRDLLLANNLFTAIPLHENTKRYVERYTGYGIDPFLRQKAQRLKENCKGGRLILAQCRTILGNRSLTDEFSRLFPKARGPWKSSSPGDLEGVFRLWHQSVDFYRSGRTYSARTDFEKWGNSRLALLLLAEQWPPAEPLLKEYRDKLNEYKQNMK